MIEHLESRIAPATLLPGAKSFGGCRIGIAPGYIHKKGNVGVVSRSGTLTYEAVCQLTTRSYGQSTCVGIGGDKEEEATAWAKDHVKKPIAAFIAGATAPPGRRMGHVGAVVSGGKGNAEGKIAALQEADIAGAPTPAVMAETLLKRWGE